MKKKSVNDSGGISMSFMKKNLLKMKLTFLCLFLSFVQLMANDGFSQSTRVTLNLKDARVEDVLMKIEEQSNLYFIYNRNIVDVNRIVNVSCTNQKVTEILNNIFSGTDVDFEVQDRHIILKSSSEPTSQPKSVSGKVTDSSGAPLPGVSVVIKGTTSGVITDMDGKFTLAKVPENAILQFSFVGMKSQEFSVTGKTSVNVTLEEETVGIEEVVAVGYGTINKQAVTGAVSQAKLKTLESVPVNNILDRIKGSVAGLNVGGTNQAGQVASINIRGQNSIAAGTSPLIVLDGAIYSGSMADISADDIENLTVLKDASATAVYGSRSANGVILVETKKGSGVNGKPKFDVSMSYGLSGQLKPLNVYDAPSYLQRLLDSRIANGSEADPDKIAIYLMEIEGKNYLATKDHQPTLKDPYSLINQLGNEFNTTVSVSNKTEKSSYYISTSLIKQKGIVINDDFKLISGRINIDSDLTSWFNLGIKSSYSLRDYSGSAPNNTAVMFSPYASVYNDDGSYRQFPQSTTSFPSPFWSMATSDLEIYNNLNGIVTGKIKIPWIKGLSYNVTYSNSLKWNERNWFYNEKTISGKGKNGIGQRAYSREYNLLFDNVIKYNRLFAEKHLFDLTLLYSREHYTWENLTGYSEGFDNTVLLDYKLENGKIQTVDTGGGETYGIGLMARLSYTYNNKYSITGTVRRDGYSAFSKNKKWGVFPSVGINWNVSREGFMNEVHFVNNLALRASYGSNGNQSISAYSTLANINTDKYFFAKDNSYTVTQYISSFANNDLGWESTTGLNMGLDFSCLNNRLSGSVDVYRTKTNNLMFKLALPAASGKSSLISNIGEIQNRGVELNLHSINLEKGDFKWSSDFAFSLNRNKVVTILGDDKNGDGKEDDLISSEIFIGKSLGTIYNYKVTGMWQQADKDNGVIMKGMRPGDFKLEDVNGDGAITSEKDRQFLGNSKENFRWSWTNSLEYKNFKLMMHFYSIWGGNNWYLSSRNTPYNDGYAGNGAINHPVYDYWTPTNTKAMFPRLDYSANAAYKGIKYIDRSFIKLQKISLGYNMTKLVKPLGINGLNIGISADNIFTYAPHWVGLDPETDSGLTDTALPSIRTYLLSLSLNF